jgi:metallo-beta-lactamase family protein
VEYSYARREKVIIPTFAVERTQEVLYSLILLRHKNMLPADLPIYVDSPLATRATDVFLKYASQLHTPEIGDISAIKNPIHNIRYTLSTQESQELNAMKGPAIILSASGMANAGRIKHHLKHNIWRPGASIVFVGYQSVGTLGRKIVDGASSIRLFNEELIVKAKVFTINGFSAHAGQTQLLEWLSPAVRPGLNVVLVHGELQKQEVLAGVIREKWKIGAQIPSPGMEITLEGGISAVHEADISTFHPRVDWNFLLEDIDTRMSQLHARMTNISDRPWEEQMDVRERLIEINRDLLDFLTHL